MRHRSNKASVSFPVTVSLSEDPGNITLTRHTDPSFSVELSARSGDPIGHPDLYFCLLSLLVEAGVAKSDKWHHLHVN